LSIFAQLLIEIMKSEEKAKIAKNISEENRLYTDVCHIIDDTRVRVATYMNTEVCMTNWNVGKRIKENVLYNQRAEYGKQVVKRLGERLTKRYGNGWGEKKLRHCLRAAETFSEDEIVYAMRTQLTWTHIKILTYIKDDLTRSFYMEMCRIEHWDTRTLEERIDGQLYERTAISRKPEEVIRQELAQIKESNQLLPDLVFRSSYFLDMLGLPDVFTERD
jgi:hypothetical protein